MQNINKHKKKIGRFVKAFDFFAPEIKLTYKNENQYKTISSGLLSIILITLFTYISYKYFATLIKKQQILSKQYKTNHPNPQLSNFYTDVNMFAIGLTNINLNSLRFFNINLTAVTVINKEKKRTQIPLQACTLDQWQKFGDDFVNHYNRLNFSQWLCPESNTILNLQGRYSSEKFQYVKIGISNCTGVVNGYGCQSAQNIQKLLKNQVNFNFYFVNRLINANKKQYCTNQLDDLNTYQFSFEQGILINYFFKEYSIETDESIFPVIQQSRIESGLMISAIEKIQLFDINQNSNQFLKFYFRKLNSTLQIKRRYLKIDEIISYIGGLFGMLFFLLKFIMNYYDILNFYLNLAKDIFYLSPNQQQTNNVKLQNFNFFTYLGYLILEFAKIADCKFLEIRSLMPYYTVIQEVKNQIDIQIVMKTLYYLKKVGKVFIDQHQSKLLYLCPKQNILQAEKNRMNFKLHKKLNEIMEIKSNQSNFSHQNKTKQIIELLQSYQNLQRNNSKVLKKLNIQITKNLDLLLQYQDPNIRSDQRLRTQEFKQNTRDMIKPEILNIKNRNQQFQIRNQEQNIQQQYIVRQIFNE